MQTQIGRKLSFGPSDSKAIAKLIFLSRYSATISPIISHTLEAACDPHPIKDLFFDIRPTEGRVVSDETSITLFSLLHLTGRSHDFYCPATLIQRLSSTGHSLLLPCTSGTVTSLLKSKASALKLLSMSAPTSSTS